MKRDEIRIAPEPLIRLKSGRAIYSVMEPGEVTVGTDKSGNPMIAFYQEGCFVLADDQGKLIVGPVDPDKAFDLAGAVCESNPIALTGAQHLHILATALLGLAACLPPPPDPIPDPVALDPTPPPLPPDGEAVEIDPDDRWKLEEL